MTNSSRTVSALLRNRNRLLASANSAFNSFVGGQSTRDLSSCTRYYILPPQKVAQSRSRIPTYSIPIIVPVRPVSSTSLILRKPDDGQSSTIDLHTLYHEQMEEIQFEREAIFGTTSSDESTDSPDLSHAAKAYFESSNDDVSQSSTPLTDPLPSPSSPYLPPNWDAEEARAEREALFAFSEEERSAWNNHNAEATTQIRSSQIQRIRELLREAPPPRVGPAESDDATQSTASSSPFSHLTPMGDGVSMVDVGHKTVSQRVALARSVVTFPPEVLSAFQVNSSYSEMIGPKGPIFETAKIAGIMGAKKTSELIPLCHPLPLDRVNIDIQLVNNQAIIECECRVTYKTGVEMEALTGAIIAALTIYDMVKAVSHRVEIGQTVLVSKRGGKSDFVHN